jgi:hypothetical protein
MIRWNDAGFPDFFDAAPRIRLRDPLARVLGAARDGVLEYGYADAVRLAGHSCPTVASAFLLTRAALAALYGPELPERGGVRVALREPAVEGVTGVLASVMALLTGATVDTGFKGLGGRFDRRRLLSFDSEIAGQVRFTRVDTGAAVIASADLQRVPGDARTGLLLSRCVTGAATPEEEAQFQFLWQERVRRLLIEHADDPQVIRVRIEQDASA